MTKGKFRIFSGKNQPKQPQKQEGTSISETITVRIQKPNGRIIKKIIKSH